MNELRVSGGRLGPPSAEHHYPQVNQPGASSAGAARRCTRGLGCTERTSGLGRAGPGHKRLTSTRCGRWIVASYYLRSFVIGLSLSLIRITRVLDTLFVALRPKCGVLGGV